MKKSILILATALFLFAGTTTVLTSCESTEKTETNETMKSDVAEEVYACPMHHTITGKKADKCSECGMDLTSTKTDPVHQGHSH